MAVILVTYQGAYAVAGLSWERSPERLSEARLGVRWGKAFAPVSELEHLGCRDVGLCGTVYPHKG
jgi:hypothetical protein